MDMQRMAIGADRLTPAGCATGAAGLAAAGTSGPAWLAVVAATTAAAISIVTSARSRRAVGWLLASPRGLDPFAWLAAGAVLAAVGGVAVRMSDVRHPASASLALLAASAAVSIGITSLLHARIREHALEVAREAAFVSAVLGVTAWLAWMEGVWVRGDVGITDATTALVVPVMAFAGFILASRLAQALGRTGWWFVAAPGALVLAGVFQAAGTASDATVWGDATAVASVAAAGLVGAGAAHRGLAGLRTSVAVSPSRVGAARIAIVVVGVLLVPLVSVGRLLTDIEVSVPSLTGSTTVLSLAAVAYLAGLAHDWAQLERRAQRDELTGLPNRRYFTERLAAAVAEAELTGARPAVLFCDLDRFKVVNDSLGHATGNQLLVALARRLGEVLPVGALAARLGGDEFAVLVPDASADEALALAQSVRGQLVLPVQVQGRTLHIDASVGVARYPDDGGAPDALVRAADTAMYSAKDHGRGRVVLHSDDLRSEMESRFALETELRSALETGQLHLVYQPRVDLRTGAIVGAEGLVRWHHPTLGSIPPRRFIPIAEESGLIRTLGVQVLRQACAQLAAWERAGLDPLVVSVNLSARQFELDRVADTVAMVLRETGADPAWLELELTESLAHHDAADVNTTLVDLADMGVRCSMDDFGTGYSGLSYLGRFPLHALKIDRAFVQAIDAPRPAGSIGDPASVVGAVIALARAFGLVVIAEGVETHAQLRFLLDHGCDELQGHLFSPPLEAEGFAALATLEADAPLRRLEVLKASLAVGDDESNVRRLGGRRASRRR